MNISKPSFPCLLCEGHLRNTSRRSIALVIRDSGWRALGKITRELSVETESITATAQLVRVALAGHVALGLVNRAIVPKHRIATNCSFLFRILFLHLVEFLFLIEPMVSLTALLSVFKTSDFEAMIRTVVETALNGHFCIVNGRGIVQCTIVVWRRLCVTVMLV